MARSMEPLVVGKVIGDVVDMFTPVADFTVHYGTKQVGNGCDIKPPAAADRPTVQITTPRDSTDLFTLIMVDPDAPSPSEPAMREWLHWIVIDVPGGGDVTKGRELISYMGPKPPTGIHRYIFLLFQQREGINATAGPPPPTRSNFSTRQFAVENGLGLPVAARYYNSQKEPATRKR